MRLYKLMTRQVKVEADCFCNKCGQVEDDLHQCHNFMVHKGFSHKNDGVRHDFDLCDRCYEKIINRFKLSVSVIGEPY
jgi:hypothetical protein